MRSHLLTGAAAAALATLTVTPAWAGSDEVAGTDATPGSSVERPTGEGGAMPEGGATESMVPAAVQTESNVDQDIGDSGIHVRADNVAVEDLGERGAEASEDPAPQGYTTNVSPGKIDDAVDVGADTPAESTAPASERMATGTPDSAEPVQTMKTAVEDGAYVEESPAEEQAAMATIEANTETVEKVVESGEVVEATPGENWFGCSDEDGSEGGTCAEDGDAARAPADDVDG